MSELNLLYGGAIQALLPAKSCDISKIRQIPDNQEVYAHSVTDQSIIFDILEYVPDISDSEALELHYKEIAGNSERTKINSIKKLDLNLENCDSVYYLYGEDLVAKYKETSKNLVNLHVVLFRYKSYQTDILVTFNDPIYINPESSSFAATPINSNQKWTLDDFMKTIESFKILDFKLFG